MTCQQTQFKSRGIFWYRNTTRPSPSVSHICQSITHFRLDNTKIFTLKIILSRFSGNDPVIIWYELPQICLECDIRQMHLESKKKSGILIFLGNFVQNIFNSTHQPLFVIRTICIIYFVYKHFITSLLEDHMAHVKNNFEVHEIRKYFFLINIVNKMEFRLEMKIFVDFPSIRHDLWSQIYFIENNFCI